MLSWWMFVEEMRGRVSMVIWGVALGVGFWCSAMRLLISRIFPRLRVIIWFHAEPSLRSMSEKMALRRASNCWLMWASSQKAKD